MKPGTTVTFTDHPASGGHTKQVKVQLASPTASALAEGFTGRSYMGVEIESRVKPVLPFPVSVDAAGIGGPSAGLAFTLAILDALSNGKLTGGHRVAATGTIDTGWRCGRRRGGTRKDRSGGKSGGPGVLCPTSRVRSREVCRRTAISRSSP